jgi:hypothetical protein
MIPYFTGRSVFVNYEMLHAVYFKNYRIIQDRKMDTWFSFFTEKDSLETSKLLDSIGITHVLLKKPYFCVVDSNIPKPYKLPVGRAFGLESVLSQHSFYSFKALGDSLRIYRLK